MYVPYTYSKINIIVFIYLENNKMSTPAWNILCIYLYIVRIYIYILVLIKFMKTELA